MPILSANIPCSRGIIAPPTIAIQRIPEPWLVNFPSFFSPSANMVGNMMELQRPMASTDHMANLPWLKMVIISNVIAVNAFAARHFSGATLLSINDPMNLPTIEPPQ